MRSYRQKVGRFINNLLDTLVGRPDLPYVFNDVKVGDRFKHLDPYHHAQQGIVTVTELTEAGFKYTIEKPYHCFPARWGAVISGEW